MYSETHRPHVSYLIVLVGGVVLEEDNALAVQTPVVSLSLLGGQGGLEVGGSRDGGKGWMGTGGEMGVDTR